MTERRPASVACWSRSEWYARISPWRGQPAGTEGEARLVSRGHRRPDDSTGRAACDVEACRFNGCRSEGPSRRPCVAAESRCRSHCEGSKRRDVGDARGLPTTSGIAASQVRQPCRMW